jgi:hypothetical protein
MYRRDLEGSEKVLRREHPNTLSPNRNYQLESKRFEIDGLFVKFDSYIIYISQHV